MTVKSQMWGLGEHSTRHKQHHNTPSATNEQLYGSLLRCSLNQFLAAISVPALTNNVTLLLHSPSQSHCMTTIQYNKFIYLLVMIQVFWDVRICYWVTVYQHFKGKQCLHLQQTSALEDGDTTFFLNVRKH
jgi:hypothetical protein